MEFEHFPGRDSLSLIFDIDNTISSIFWMLVQSNKALGTREFLVPDFLKDRIQARAIDEVENLFSEAKQSKHFNKRLEWTIPRWGEVLRVLYCRS